MLQKSHENSQHYGSFRKHIKTFCCGMSPTSANNFWAIFIILKYKISANIISLPLVTAELTFGQVEEQATL